MNASKSRPSGLDRVAEDLFNYAIDREDIKWLMEKLPEAAEIQRSRVEFELQILKIISVGWSISFYLDDRSEKTVLLDGFWRAIHEFSGSLSTTTGLVTGHEIDYFQTLKERLDMYVNALADQPQAPEPARVIGPAFARMCGNENDLFAFMTGSKMFISALGRVKAYLEATGLL
ncbi:MAG: hypothetical protein ACOWWM_02345 [Desulfobacterales bacterium]